MHMRTTILGGLLAGLAFVLPAAAGAATFDFTTNSGKFEILNDTIDFGNDVQISSASSNSGGDPSIFGYVVDLDDVVLDSSTLSEVGSSGIFTVDVVPDTYEMRIFDGGGSLAMTADFDPGSFITVGSAANLSPEITASVTNISVTNGSDALADLASDLAEGKSIDFAISLTTSSQDIAGRLEIGNRVSGALSGSVGTIGNVIPEPGTALLLLGGLGGLGALGRRRPEA